MRGQGKKVNRLRLWVAQKVSIAQRHQGLLSLLLKEVQVTLKGLRIRLVQPGRSTGEFLVIGRRLEHRGAGRVVETAEGEEEGSQQHSRHISIARTRGQERSSVFLAFSEQNALPSTSERITLTLNSLTSVIDCSTRSKPPPKCTKCCSICCKRKLTKSSVSSLALHCRLLDRSSREFLSPAKKSVRSIPSAIF